MSAKISDAAFILGDFMFERVNFKKAAKAQLKGRWKVPVLTTLLIYVILLVFSSALGALNAASSNFYLEAANGKFNFGYSDKSGTSSLLTLLFVCLTSIFLLAQKSMLEVMKNESRAVKFDDWLNGLNQWWQGFRGALWHFLWVTVWSFLFLIPGIVKAYAYSMMFYVMAENPKIKVRKAMNLSKELTRGYKGDLFVMDLSFIPWLLLCGITGGIAALWFVPYYQAVRMNAYHYLKQIALNSGRVKNEDFGE